MHRALELAGRGLGRVEPNPMVGAVLFDADGQRLGEGWHDRFGGPHAEVNAIAHAGRSGRDLRGAGMAVTLEPCSHFGKTPPCANAIISTGLRRVVVAMVDPDEQVAGRGVEMLRQAGVEVEVGCCEAKARHLLREYITLRTRGRPWVIAKWAQTADGYLALPAEQGRWISSPASRQRVHEMRSWVDAILVGRSTVLADDPLLTNRSGRGRQPTRIILARQLDLPDACRLLRTAGDCPVLLATTATAAESASAGALRAGGVEILALPEADGGRVDLTALLGEMGQRQWTRLLIEGGADVLGQFIGQGLADEIHAYVAPQAIGPIELPRFDVNDLPGEHYRPVSDEALGDDRLVICERREG
jgi:diaminohydroxyphosphoribosylaminopyrimidine deaminase/5-amino-6-(5-phosphoribosylamino)uracil reductase